MSTRKVDGDEAKAHPRIETDISISTPDYWKKQDNEQNTKSGQYAVILYFIFTKAGQINVLPSDIENN